MILVEGHMKDTHMLLVALDMIFSYFTDKFCTKTGLWRGLQKKNECMEFVQMRGRGQTLNPNFLGIQVESDLNDTMIGNQHCCRV